MKDFKKKKEKVNKFEFVKTTNLAFCCNGLDGNESACSAGDPGLIPGSGRSPGEKEWQLNPVFVPGEFHGQRKLAAYSR